MKLAYSIPCIILMATIVSFLGFVVENVWLTFTKGYIDNRNMALPFLLGYGLAIVTLFILLGTPRCSTFFDRLPFLDTSFKRISFYFLCAFFFVCVAEILLGTLIEKTCHIVLWNYSRFTLHITKYTSIPTSSGFAFIITFFMDKCFTPIMDAISQIDYETSKDISIVFLALMVCDFCVNSFKMFKNKSLNPIWRIDLRRHQDNE
ncbi:MAG: putative ABC transporter permease [Ruminococcus sp.]|nr:putative ABC transporter permease [Ruminococcus sp.]